MTHIIRQHRAGEERAGLFTPNGRALRVFVHRSWASEAHAFPGAKLAAIVRSADPGAGGAFVDFEAGGEGFLRVGKGVKLPPEGKRLPVIVTAAARPEKLARVRPATPEEEGATSAFEAFLASLPGAAPDIETIDSWGPDAELDAAFDEAIAREATLPGGGRLTLETARALTVIDVDSHGRPMQGKAGKDALNREAMAEAGRLIALSETGGLGVIDGVGGGGGHRPGAPHPLAAGFLGAVREATVRKAMVFGPSRLGLVEFSLSHQFGTIREALAGPGAQALDALAQLAGALEQSRGASLALHAPETVLTWLDAAPFDWRGQLAGRYGPRFGISAVPALKTSVSET